MTQHTTTKAAFVAMLEQFKPGSIKHALFTSFNFSSTFFESNLLPLLSDWQNPDEVQNLTPLRINQTLQNTQVTVVCDSSTEPQAKGHYRYEQLCLKIPGGFFHPKLILLQGTLKDSGQAGAMLMVGSGNLTLSGWGLNREVVGCCRVNDQHLNALSKLNHWLVAQAQLQFESITAINGDAGEDAVVNNLNTMQQAMGNIEPHHDNNAPFLHIRLPQTDKGGFLKAMLQRLDEKTFDSVHVISPFWSAYDPVKQLLNQLDYRRLILVPSLNDQGQYALPKCIRDNLKAVEYHRFSPSKHTCERYTHAKTLILTGSNKVYYLIGSANFTGPALGNMVQGNVEAMLSYSIDKKKAPKLSFEVLGDDINWADNQDDCDAPKGPPFDVLAYYDWKTGLFYCQIEQPPNSPDKFKGEFAQVTLRFDHCQCKQAIELAEAVNQMTLHFDDASHQFPVRQLNGQPDQLGYEPKPDLNHMLRHLLTMDLTQPGNDKGGITRETARGPEQSEEDNQWVEFEFFTLFQSFYKLRAFFDKNRHIDPFDDTSNNALPLFYRAAELEQAHTDMSKAQILIKQFIVYCELLYSAQALDQKPYNGTALIDKLKAKVKTLESDFIRLLTVSPLLRQSQIEQNKENITAIYRWFVDEMGLKR